MRNYTPGSTVPIELWIPVLEQGKHHRRHYRHVNESDDRSSTSSQALVENQLDGIQRADDEGSYNKDIPRQCLKLELLRA